MLEKNNISVEIKDDARKRKIDKNAAWEIIEKFDSIIIGQGKKYTPYSPDKSNREIILKAAIGRSGNLRAPTLELKGTLIVGYNEAVYQEFVH